MKCGEASGASYSRGGSGYESTAMMRSIQPPESKQATTLQVTDFISDNHSNLPTNLPTCIIVIAIRRLLEDRSFWLVDICREKETYWQN